MVSPARLQGHTRRDEAGAVEGLGVAGIDLDVVGNALVDHIGLRRSHPRCPITSGYLPPGGDQRVAVHANPAA